MLELGLILANAVRAEEEPRRKRQSEKIPIYRLSRASTAAICCFSRRNEGTDLCGEVGEVDEVGGASQKRLKGRTEGTDFLSQSPRPQWQL